MKTTGFFVFGFLALLSTNSFAFEKFEDSEDYRNYELMPDSVKSDTMFKIYSDGYYAKQKLINTPSSKGGTIGQYLDKKAAIPAVDDFGWSTHPPTEKNNYHYIERAMEVSGMRLLYAWEVYPDGKVIPVNGKAIGITK